jgi:hypothetical protein
VWLFLSTAAIVFAAPHVSIIPEEITVRAEKSFDVFINVSWNGDAEEYIIVPPDLQLPEGFHKVSSSFLSSARQNSQLIKYHYILKSQNKGAFTIPPVEIKYWGKESKEENFVSTEQVSIDVTGFTFFGLNTTWIITSIAAAVLIAVFAIAFVTNKQLSKKKKNLRKNKDSEKQQLITSLQNCREHKIKGDYSGFFQCAVDAAGQIPDMDQAFIDNLTDSLGKVRFGGYRPTAEEVDRIFRSIEKPARDIISDKKDEEREYEKYCKD